MTQTKVGVQIAVLRKLIEGQDWIFYSAMGTPEPKIGDQLLVQAFKKCHDCDGYGRKTGPCVKCGHEGDYSWVDGGRFHNAETPRGTGIFYLLNPPLRRQREVPSSDAPSASERCTE